MTFSTEGGGGIPGSRTLGVVLAGGRSRRFGSPKALATFLGTPLILRPVEALRGVCSEVVVVGGDPDGELAGVLPVPLLSDQEPGQGPLGGLVTALNHARSRRFQGVLLLGCDMPLVSTSLLRRVAGEGEASGESAVAPEDASGRLHPLCAWYPVGTLPVALQALSSSDRSLMGLLKGLGARRLVLGDASRGARVEAELAGANTPDELAALEGKVSGSGGRGDSARRPDTPSLPPHNEDTLRP